MSSSCSRRSRPWSCARGRDERPNGRRRIVNAMTVDVEDYFQVRRSTASCRARDGIRSRAASAPTPTGCSRSSTARTCARRSSCSGGWPSGFRRWCAGSRIRATRSRRTATPIGSSTIRRRRHFGTMCGGEEALEDAAGVRVVGYRAPSYSMIDAIAVGARRADRGRVSPTTPASSRSITIATAFRLAAASRPHGAARPGSLVEVPGVDRAARRREPADRRRRLFPAAAVCRGRGGASTA